MNLLGEKIKEYRKKSKLSLKSVATELKIDIAILSKIENGHRKASRETIVDLARILKVEENELLKLWLSDKVLYEIQDEELASEALKVAEETLIYQKREKLNTQTIIQELHNYFKKNELVKNAWIFGSYARNEADKKSDIDIMIEVFENKNFGLFDLFEIQHELEAKYKRKVDMVEKGQVKSFAVDSVNRDLKIIIEKDETR
jgi:predicted nucleotidyltransferase/plasmid maintenance system antidote protein VapI